MRKRAQDYNLTFGSFRKGKHNAIIDVPGVRVGHRTILQDSPSIARTGATAILCGEGDSFVSPVFAAASVINGYGKSVGLVQIEELGSIETPIVLTNTLSVGVAASALVEYTVGRHANCLSVSPVVGECNDSKLNDIRQLMVKKQDIIQAVENAGREDIELGSVGAGTGMVCFGYKGGIGSSSRIISLEGHDYTIGVLVLTNFGKMNDLTIKGQRIRPFFETSLKCGSEGSIMIVIGTDIPLTYRQLKRMSRRAVFGIARTGGRCAHGSGEIVIAFSNGNRFFRGEGPQIRSIHMITEDAETTSSLFNSVIDGVEEAIIDSLFTSETVSGYQNFVAEALPVDDLMQMYDFFNNDFK